MKRSSMLAVLVALVTLPLLAAVSASAGAGCCEPGCCAKTAATSFHSVGSAGRRWAGLTNASASAGCAGVAASSMSPRTRLAAAHCRR